MNRNQKAFSAGKQNQLVGCSPYPSYNLRLAGLAKARLAGSEKMFHVELSKAHELFFLRRGISTKNLSHGENPPTFSEATGGRQ